VSYRTSGRQGASGRRRRGVALLVGAAATAALAGHGPLDLTWVPLLLGGSFLLAALAGGARGPLWAPGLVLLAFGGGALLYLGGHLPRGVQEAPAYLVAAGVGVLLCALAQRADFAVDLSGAGAAILAEGVLFALQRRYGGVWSKPDLYAGLLAAWGLWEIRPGRG